MLKGRTPSFSHLGVIIHALLVFLRASLGSLRAGFHLLSNRMASSLRSHDQGQPIAGQPIAVQPTFCFRESLNVSKISILRKFPALNQN